MAINLYVYRRPGKFLAVHMAIGVLLVRKRVYAIMNLLFLLGIIFYI